MRVQLHPAAEEELFQAVLYHENQVAGLGNDLLTEAGHWLEVVRETPLTWPRWPDAPDLDPPVRRVLMRRFPFSVAYQAFTDRVWILAFAHTSRRPLYWSGRADDDRTKNA